MKFSLFVCCLLSVSQAQEITLDKAGGQKGDPVGGLSDSILQFSHKVYLNMRQIPDIGNFAFSPLSLHTVLTLLKLGATPDSQTEAELVSALDSFIDIHKVTEAYSKIVNDYNRGNLAYGNHIWVNQQFKLNNNYIREASQLNAKVSSLNFTDASSVDTINSWVRKLTNNKIESLVDSLPSDTEMVIGNALYLKERWTNSFTESKTPTKFLLKGGNSVDILMMERTDGDFSYGTFGLLGDDRHEVIIIPYENSDLEFIIILPNPRFGGSGLEEIDKNLGFQSAMNLAENHQYENILKKAKKSAKPVLGELHLTMPRFDSGLDLDVSQILENLGIKSIFTGKAELSNLAEVTNLRVDKIVQKALISVDLEGTEAAAATFISIATFSAQLERPQEVSVNRPFLFQVYDKINNIPVFLGRIIDPTNQQI